MNDSLTAAVLTAVHQRRPPWRLALSTALPHQLVDTTSTAGRYTLLRKIADGGMGHVYEARLAGVEGFEKTVAIKTILEGMSSDPEFVRMFIGEARLVADLVHENIVQVYQLGRSGAVYYMALEYVEGLNLEQLMVHHLERGERIPLELGVFIISRICRGLEHAHARRGSDGQPLGIVHRDISPKNVMISYEGVVKLTDFGIAKARQLMEQREGEVLMGKAEYMSPEQARFEATDRRSDIFSLGILMAELLLGTHLFKAPSIVETLKAVLDKPLPDLVALRPDLPADILQILTKALQRDPALRYQTAGEMGYDLEYHMYHDRFGPTNVTLGTYLRERFRPGQQAAAPAPGDDESFRRRADNLASPQVTPARAAAPQEAEYDLF